MPTRPNTTNFRFDPLTLADLDALAARLRTSRTGVVREAVRRLAAAELPRDGGEKKFKKSSNQV